MESSLLPFYIVNGCAFFQRLAVSSVYSRVVRITVFHPMPFWDYWRASHTDYYKRTFLVFCTCHIFLTLLHFSVGTISDCLVMPEQVWI